MGIPEVLMHHVQAIIIESRMKSGMLLSRF
jgi:hypothetical protein